MWHAFSSPLAAQCALIRAIEVHVPAIKLLAIFSPPSGCSEATEKVQYSPPHSVVQEDWQERGESKSWRDCSAGDESPQGEGSHSQGNRCTAAERDEDAVQEGSALPVTQ